ncbi:unnamed protein product [Echinostoma caproni]|uniref:Sulfotransfer_1 domain-containing protein n=1 Tax=Echinostoma caproni TaxID=27848 RepID=A0A183AT15_9TREM|nr:unnamed protein product [Echinostoma caproni]
MPNHVAAHYHDRERLCMNGLESGAYLSLAGDNYPVKCQDLSHFLQKAPGSTALVHFLRLHPRLAINRYQFPTTFEELQFFSSDEIYARGVHWYFTQLNDSHAASANLSSAERVLFEKSATYFASAKAPARIHALVPSVQLIVLLRDPVERAYSWYQHMLAHGDIAPQLISFMDLMRFGSNITAPDLIRRSQSTELHRLGVNPSNRTSVLTVDSLVQFLVVIV